MKNFKILHNGVGVYSQGQVVPQSVFPDTDRLLRLGAVEETDEPLTVLEEGDAPLPGLTTGKPEGLTEETPSLPVTRDLPPATVDALTAAGYDTAAKIADASDEDLKKVPGVGDATVAKLRALHGA